MLLSDSVAHCWNYFKEPSHDKKNENNLLQINQLCFPTFYLLLSKVL